MNPVLQLIQHGQSYWMDNLSRGMIKSGELEKRVSKQGLRGITSNPKIFDQAISGSEDYDDQIKQLINKKKAVHEIYEALVVKDVQDACDILRPVYDESDGLDGFVSLEVSPYLAHDTNGTMAEVRRLFEAVDRPNVFIKIPGTPAGVPAIEQMLYEGININITLLFSIESYEAVAKAYIKALERRVAEDKSIKNLTSVASFFLSRIDVLADQLLGHLIIPEQYEGDRPRPEQLLGKVAVANAKLAYQSFKKIFSGERWHALVEKGARVQRPLWASTSTKNPIYSDVRYVEPLIGPHTVNTMPEKTIEAFADHGVLVENSVEADVNKARQIFSDLKEVGIDLDFVTRQLINEGVQKFIDPYDELMKTIAKYRQDYLDQNMARQTIHFGDLKSKIDSAYEELEAQQFARRLFARDPYLWKSDPKMVESISHRLGWLDSVEEFCRKADEIKSFAEKIKDEKFDRVVLLGMGGSSLCPEVCMQTFGSAKGWPEFLVLDNTDPEAVEQVQANINLQKTLFLISSKSGTTTETLSFYRYFYEKVKGLTGHAGEQFVAITDPGSPLIEEAKGKRFRQIFENPPDIGGRYSALSYFGLVPMALLGMDITTILNNAHQMQLSCGPFIPTEHNPAISLGVFLGLYYRYLRDKITFILSDSLASFGDWVEQLLAESTGKEGNGLVPVVREPLGPPAVYGDDRIFVYLYTVDQATKETDQKLQALEDAGHPVVRIELRNKMSLGAEFYRWELATAAAGAIMSVNPFDEPNVAESKKNTHDLLKEWQQKGRLDEGRALFEERPIAVFASESLGWISQVERSSMTAFLNSFLKLAKAPDYIALLPYFAHHSTRHEIMTELRFKLRDRFKVATTVGYGPRYLHSTGQLHKGGLNTGLFVMFTADPEHDQNIPGQEYGFATLQRAQALGDFRSLNDKERRVIRIHLGDDIEFGLRKVFGMIK